MERIELSELLYRAEAAEIGILVSTNNPERLRQKLYPLRKELNLLHLSFLISPFNPNDLWILKNGT